MTKLANHFFKGLLVSVPALVTLLIAAWVFQWLYGFVSPFFSATDQPALWIKVLLTVGVLVTMLVIITVIGFAASNIIGQQAIRWLDKHLEKLPVFKMIYTSVKDITQAFGGEKKKFDKPVLVRPVPGSLQMFGFVTSESLDFAGIKDKISVYLPLSYNFCGIMVVVPRDQIEPIDLDSKDAMTFVFSGGIVKGHKEVLTAPK
jgi:uncharacterized membrane protein